MSEHTPTPWTAEQQKSRAGEPLGWIINHANGRIGWSSYATAVPNEGEAVPYEIGGANAAFIVRACNSHEALVALAKQVALTYADTDAPWGEQARAALKLAGAA